MSKTINLSSDPFSILKTRTKDLDRTIFGYKLADNQYGLDVSFSDDMDIDEKAMSVLIPFADGNARDGVGDVLEVGGIRTERHQLNPIVLFDHGKTVSLPIALAEDPNTKGYTVQIDPVSRTARANCFFYQGKGMVGISPDKEYDHALFCQQLFDLISKRYIRAGSIGYQVIHAKNLTPDYDRGTPAGLHLLSVLMLELSAVVLPANGDTVRKALCLPSVCGKPLSPYLVKSLTPYASEEVKVVSGYKGKGYLEDLARQLRNDETIRGLLLGIRESGSKDPTARRIIRDRIDELGVSIKPGYEGFLIAHMLQTMGKSQPSEDIPPDKARQILKDGEVHGKPLTEKQRGMFGAAANKDLDNIRLKYQTKNSDLDALVSELESYRYRHASLWELGAKLGWDKNRLVNAVNEGRRQRVLTGSQFEGGPSQSHLTDRERSWIVRPDNLSGADSLAYVSLRKNMNGEEKSLDDIRMKYRSAKNYRIRRKKSSPGTSITYLREKDLKAAQEMADQKGIRFERVGTKGDLEKVRLSGDDKSIDEVVKNFGTKSLGVNSMNKKVKAMDTSKDEEETITDDRPDYSNEPYGSQVLRRLHEDHSILMKEYDEMMGPLENESVRDHLQEKLEHIEKFLSATEKLHGKHYKDLNDLTGKPRKKDMTEDEAEDIKEDIDEEVEDVEEPEEAKDMDTMDDAAVPSSDNAEEKEPTPEEAIEGMRKEKKSLNGYHQKAPKKGGKKKESGGEFWRVYQGAISDDYDPDQAATMAHAATGKTLAEATREKYLSKGVCPECGKEPCSCPGATGEKIAPLIAAAAPAVISAVASKLSSSEKGMVKEASGFLGDLSKPDSILDEEGRMKSYHYHKTMEGIASLEEAHDDLNQTPTESNVPPAEFEPGAGAKSIGSTIAKNPRVRAAARGAVRGAIEGAMSGKGTKADPGTPEWEQEEMQEEEHQEKMSHRKMCKEASGFFRELSQTRDFGDPHRQKASHYKQMLDGIGSDKEESSEEEKEKSVPEPGEMGEKSMNILKLTFESENKKIEELNRKLSAIMN